jgi:hypothetical protein
MDEREYVDDTDAILTVARSTSRFSPPTTPAVAI